MYGVGCMESPIGWRRMRAEGGYLQDGRKKLTRLSRRVGSGAAIGSCTC